MFLDDIFCYQECEIVCFSPHIDDIAYSLGGLLGNAPLKHVHIINAFSSSCFYDGKAYNNSYALSITNIRKMEDRYFCEANGFTVSFLDFEDSSMRNLETYFNLVPDPVLINALANAICAELELIPNPVIFRPLAVGGHIDHVVLDMALEKVFTKVTSQTQFFYEDMPYAAELTKYQSEEYIQNRLGSCAEYCDFLMTASEWEKKRKSLMYYKSQVSPKDIALTMSYAQSIAMKPGYFAERFWTKCK